MLSIKKILFASSLVFSGLALSVVAFAQGSSMSLDINNSGNVNLTGSVSAISSPNISVTSWGGTWTINTAGAKILPSDEKTNNNSLADIKIGDIVRVSGKVTSGMNITATRVIDKSLRPVKSEANVGTINNINISQGTFNLLTNGGKNIGVASTSGTSVFLNGSTSSFANLTNNMKVAVSGTINTTTNTISANIIHAFNIGSDVNVKMQGNKNGFWMKLFGAFGKKNK